MLGKLQQFLPEKKNTDSSILLLAALHTRVRVQVSRLITDDESRVQPSKQRKGGEEKQHLSSAHFHRATLTLCSIPFPPTFSDINLLFLPADCLASQPICTVYVSSWLVRAGRKGVVAWKSLTLIRRFINFFSIFRSG